MIGRNQDTSNRENVGPDPALDAYIGAVKDKRSKSSLDERVASWWAFDGNWLVGSLMRGKERAPSYLEALALASGDLEFDEDGFARLSDNFAEALFNFSHQSPAGYELAKRICVINLRLKKLQPELQVLAALVMSGELRKPRQANGRASKNWYRDLLIVRGVASTQRRGVTATRNDVSDRTSGCDLVAEAFKKAGRRDAPTYETVKKIWQRRDELFKDDEDIRFLEYRQFYGPDN